MVKYYQTVICQDVEDKIYEFTKRLTKLMCRIILNIIRLCEALNVTQSLTEVTRSDFTPLSCLRLCPYDDR